MSDSTVHLHVKLSLFTHPYSFVSTYDFLYPVVHKGHVNKVTQLSFLYRIKDVMIVKIVSVSIIQHDLFHARNKFNVRVSK